MAQMTGDRKKGLAGLVLLALLAAAAQSRKVGTFLVARSSGGGYNPGGGVGGGGQTYLEKLDMGMTEAWSPPVPHGTDYFGKDTRGTSPGSIKDTIRGSSGSPAYDGQATKIHVHLYNWSSGFEVKCALYKASDESLVGSTVERSDGGNNWETFVFAAPVNILAAETYYIVVMSDDAVMYDLEPTETGGSWKGATYPTWPDPLGRTPDWPGGIYCEYDY